MSMRGGEYVRSRGLTVQHLCFVEFDCLPKSLGHLCKLVG